MSGNQETRVGTAAQQCFNINAAIPIKKRRYLVRPPSPPTEEVSPKLPENCSQPNEQGSSSIAVSVSRSLDVNEKALPQEKGDCSVTIAETGKKIVDPPSVYVEKPIPSVESVSVANPEKKEKDVDGNASVTLGCSLEGKAKLANTGSIVRGIFDQYRVKTEQPNLPVHSVSLAGIQTEVHAVKPSSTKILGGSVQFPSLAKPANTDLVEAESSNLFLSSEKIEAKVTQPLLTMHDMIDKTCDKKIGQGECQTKVSSGSGIADLTLGRKTGNSQYQESEELLSLNLSLSKGDSVAHDTDGISIGKSAGVDNGISRSNWDLNTTMDDWEDVHGTSIGEPHLAFLSNNSTPHDSKALSSHDKTVSAIGEQQKECVRFRSDVLTSLQSDEQDNPGCSLSLGLGSFRLTEKPHRLLASRNQGGAGYTCFSGPVMTTRNENSVNLRIVKSEPVDEIVRQGTGNGRDSHMILPNNRVKHELVERCSNEASSSSGGFSKSVDPTTIKAEANNSAQSEIINSKAETLNHPDKLTIQSNKTQDLPIYSMSDHRDKQMSYSIGSRRAPTPLTDMAINACDLNYSECLVHENAAHGKPCKTLMHADSESFSSSLGHDNNNLNVSGVTVTSLTEDKTIDDPKICRMKELPPDSRGTEASSLSDEEKINLSGDMLEEEVYGSDFESDGGHDLSKLKKKKDGRINGHEDGNVQGSVAIFAEENSTAKKSETEPSNCGNSEAKSAGLYACGFENPIHVEEKGSGSSGHGEANNDHNNDHIKESTGASFDNKHVDDDDSYLMETVEMPSCEIEIKRLIPELQSRPHDGSGEKEGRTIQDGESSDQVIHTSQGISSASTVSSGNVQNLEMVEKSSSPSCKAEISTGADDAPKEISGGCNHRRIINLARVSSKSPVKTPDASGSCMQSQIAREKLPDLPLEGRRFLPRGRDEAFIDDSYKFSRARFHDQFIRNPRTNLMPDRRRFSDRTESSLRDRDSENFEFNNFGNTHQDGAFVRSFRRGKRPLTDETTFFSHAFSRRRSPGFPFAHRGPRNSDDGFAFHGHRNGEKFMRGLPRDNFDPMFTRPQRTHEDFDGRVVRGRKNFSTFHRRGPPRFRSRSPTRSRARSPGPCSSFRSRSPDGFGGHSSSPCRRSPPGYRMERMRSPDRSGFPRDMVVRRHGSPSYLSRPSNTPRDMGSGRGRGYRRPGISFRNQSDRVFFRQRGRFNILNGRERVEYGDDFFGGPMHSGRFGEFGVDGNTKRRRFGGRRDTYSFRPSFNTEDCAPSNAENDHDAVRFGQEDEAEIDEQGNLSEFDTQDENHTGDAPRGARNAEEKEESSGQGGEIWHGNEFDDEQAKEKGY